MTKKVLENEKNIFKDADINSYKMEQFNSDVCKLKHLAIDKELKNIETNDNKRHEELIVMIQNIREDIKKDVKSDNNSMKEDVKSSYNNLKDKIILTEKIIGEKIDNLSDFDDTLKGNGNPGIWESIRNLRWKFRIVVAMFIIMFILVVGGDFRGVTVDKIKDILGMGKQVESKQIEKEKKESIEKDLIIGEKTEIIKNYEPFFANPQIERTDADRTKKTM